MTQQKRKRWKSNKYEIQQGEGPQFYWFMRATQREEKRPITLAELKELHDLIARVLKDQEEND